ncbi:MAG: pyridoxal phosphate-dependent decarboxylase family protein [Acidimicrobiales bacterium]
MSDGERPPGDEAAELARLEEAVRAVLPALEAFNRFEGADQAARRRPSWQARLDLPLPSEGLGLDAVVEELTRSAIPYGVRTGAPGFCGWVTTAPTTAGVVATLAATVAGSQRYFTQPFNLLEALGLRWLAELVGLPATFQGVFGSGGSMANLIALGAARQSAFERIGHDPSADGVPAGVQTRIYASRQVHHVVKRAAAVLGLGRRSVVLVDVDDDHRIDLVALRQVLDDDIRRGILPVALVASAGTVDTGAVDPLAAMADMAAERGVWLHVDGAYGLFGVLDPSVAGLFDGLDRADSVAVDPHKWLAVPIGCGATFVRDPALLERAFTLEPAGYLARPPVDPADGPPASPFADIGERFLDFGIEQSAPSRGVLVWAALLEIGASGMRARVQRHIAFARRVTALASADESLEVMAPPSLSIACFRYRRPGLTEDQLEDLNQRVVSRLWADSVYVPSTTRLDGRLAIRCCFINPRTTWADVDGLVAAVRRAGDALLGGE